MRNLSQDNGKYDLPYENIVLEKMMDCNTIYVYTGTGQPFKMAVYSSAEKMNKAMEMLREEYTFEKQFETICSGTTDYPSKPTYYFRFPSDDEVGV